MNKEKLELCVPHLRDAIEAMWDMWDALRNIELITETEIESDALMTCDLAACSRSDLTDENLTEVLKKLIK